MKVREEINKTLLKMKVILLPTQRLEKNEKKVGKLAAFKSLRKPLEIEKLVKKLKSAYRRIFEKSMTAATFAEAGEFDIAKDIMGNEIKG